MLHMKTAFILVIFLLEWRCGLGSLCWKLACCFHRYLCSTKHSLVGYLLSVRQRAKRKQIGFVSEEVTAKKLREVSCQWQHQVMHSSFLGKKWECRAGVTAWKIWGELHEEKTFVWVLKQVKLFWCIPGMAQVLVGEGTDSGSPFGRCEGEWWETALERWVSATPDFEIHPIGNERYWKGVWMHMGHGGICVLERGLVFEWRPIIHHHCLITY